MDAVGRFGGFGPDPVDANAALVGYWVVSWHHRRRGDRSCPVVGKEEGGWEIAAPTGAGNCVR